MKPTLIPVVALFLAAPAVAGENLQKAYPGSMRHSEFGLNARCTPEDVWELKSFHLRFGKELELECKAATVAFGVYERNVLWAAVFPADPPEIQTEGQGGGEHANTIFLRFSPAEVGKVFPSKTVVGRGSTWKRAAASRMARHKIRAYDWYTPAGNPTVVPGGWTLVDMDTDTGMRRSYAIDRNASVLHYVSDLERKPVPPSPPIDEKDALEAFDQVWETFDREYACFVLTPDVDWDALGKSYRKLAAKAPTVYELAAVISDMLAHLENLHVWVLAGDEGVPGFYRARPQNGSWKATHAIVNATNKAGKELTWGRTEDGIGYIGVHGLTDETLPDEVDRALEQLADTWAMIVDIRFNGGGGEDLAWGIVSRFLDEERVYSVNQYRSGSKHDSLGPKLERTFAPRGPWRYESPVVALWGQRTFSSAESMALMLAQCPQVTTMGDRTGGSSANPRRLELDCGITVNVPRWLDMDPDGHPIEHVGIAPQVPVAAEPDEFTDEEDPVLEAALRHLRKSSKNKRRPGRRDEN